MKVRKFGEYLIEASKFPYKIGDKVLIEYWYNGMITPVVIKEIIGSKITISHNLSESEIYNAPNEIIKKSDIIDYFKGYNKNKTINLE